MLAACRALDCAKGAIVEAVSPIHLDGPGSESPPYLFGLQPADGARDKPTTSEGREASTVCLDTSCLLSKTPAVCYLARCPEKRAGPANLRDRKDEPSPIPDRLP